MYEQLAKQFDFSDLPLHIVFGGDGWMLECIRKYGTSTTYFGINAGTLGFLMNSNSDLPLLLKSLQERSWIEHSFPLLHVTGLSIHGTQINGLALNDIYVARMGGVAANLRIDIDNVNIVEKLVCDGLIVASALGSTAYSASAGGSPSHPLLPGMHITPICAHTPRLRPFIIPDTAKIKISVLSPERRRVQAVGDGSSFGEVHDATISRSTKAIRLAFVSDDHLTERMVRKILRP
jgi:NAD+ kinase